ncbi:MAG TPA: ABC transporter ATP-binding protein [Vicinamibacterales bacterium]|nr:ABC transporter ATP-binding protein [Vicinamibacterales bacterium]
MTAPAAISLRDVSKRYGRIEALRGVTLDVHRGEMFGLIGPDGAGKTTAIRIMCGLLHVDEGEVRIAERDPVREHRAVSERVGYLSQRFSLYGDLSIDENVAFFAEIHGLRDYGSRRERLLDMTRLGQFRARRADRLSGGMKQKLALACTLVHQPEILVLDEPTTGVDPVSRREFWKLLSEFLAEGLTIVMATPYLDEAERCGRVALLHDGRLLAVDEPGRLQKAFEGELYEVVGEPHQAAFDAIAAVPGVRDRQTFGERIHVRAASTNPGALGDDIRRALERARVQSIGVRRIVPSLEDVFIDRVRAAGARDVQEGS